MTILSVIALGLPLLQVTPPPLKKSDVPTVQEKVTVSRVVITGRVLDRFANPIPNLSAADLRLRVDGRAAEIESVDWVAEPGQLRQSAVTVADHPDPGVPRLEIPERLRLTVMLFQWEIAGQKDVGFVRMMRQAARIVEASRPSDRIAVFGFGSRLRLLQDFTADHGAVEEAINNIRSGSWIGRPAEANGPSVAAGTEECGWTDSIEKGLLCIGNALAEFTGTKTMLFFGWTAATTRETWRNEYPSILEAISRSETSVSVLDVSDGRRVPRQRVLTQSLRSLAADTGGLYNETFDFPDLARQRVQRSIEGHYEIVFRDPASSRGWHQVEVELVGRAGTALFHRWYRD